MLPNILDENVPTAEEYLEGAAKTSSLQGLRTATRVLTGHPAEAIIQEAIADKVDLVVMCSHGYTPVMRWSMGSIAAKVARYAPSPVFIIHEGGALTTEGKAHSIRVLVALDGSEYAESIIVPAAQLAWALSAPARGELHLTRVISTRGEEVRSFDEERERTQQYLRSIGERLQHAPLTDAGVPLDLLITWSVTMAEDAASGIMQAAESRGTGEDAGQDEPCQVIAMATHGIGGPQLWTMGSTAERVLQVAQQPLLIVRR